MSSSARHLEELIVQRLGGADANAAVRRACSAVLLETNALPPPIRLAPMARHLGARIRYEDNLKVGAEEASLKIVDERLILWVSRSSFENPNFRQRARFSIAHEIGHLILYKILGPEFLEHTEADHSSFTMTERLCDFAASHILMPRDYLSEALRARDLSERAVRDISKLFDVSFTSLLKAVSDLVPKGAIVEWRKYRRHGGEHLAWRVWNTYTPSNSKGLESWLPKGCTLKHVDGFGDPGTLLLNQPQTRKGLVLNLGGRKTNRDGVVCRWPLTRSNQMKLANEPRLGEFGPEFTIDDSAGRLILLLAEKQRLDFSLFGATS